VRGTPGTIGVTVFGSAKVETATLRLDQEFGKFIPRLESLKLERDVRTIWWFGFYVFSSSSSMESRSIE
jgi:hypothetical protein